MENLAYSKQVMKRFLNPKFMGKIEKADAIGESGNPSCGDIMKIYIKVGKNKKNQKIIKDIRFQTMGCVAAIASTDAVCALAKGKTLEYAKKIKKIDIMNNLKGLPKVKVHCSVLGEETLRKAIEGYERNKNK